LREKIDVVMIGCCVLVYEYEWSKRREKIDMTQSRGGATHHGNQTLPYMLVKIKEEERRNEIYIQDSKNHD
jgi:hypothetical protein